MVFFVMSVNAMSAGRPAVSRAATAAKSCRYALMVCAEGLRVARSIRKSANQFGVPVAVSPSDSGVDTAGSASRGASVAGGVLLLRKRRGTSPVSPKKMDNHAYPPNVLADSRIGSSSFR